HPLDLRAVRGEFGLRQPGRQGVGRLVPDGVGDVDGAEPVAGGGQQIHGNLGPGGRVWISYCNGCGLEWHGRATMTRVINEYLHDRGRGPELIGNRITVYDLVPYLE